MRVSRLSATLLVGALVGCTDPEEPPPPPPPVTETEITFNLLPADAAAPGELRVSFVAYQDGTDGEWKPMPEQGGVRKVKITSERFGLALACANKPGNPSGTLSSISVTYSTVTEAKEIRDESCFLPGATTSVMRPIMVSGLGANESVRFEYGFFNAQEVSANGASELSGPRGALPAMALIYASPPPRPSTATPTRVVRLPDLNLALSSPLAIDVSGGEALVSAPVIVPAGLSVASIRTLVRNGNDTFIARINGTVERYSSVPASLLRPGDAIRVTATIDGDENFDRISIFYLGAPSPLTIEAIDPLPAVSPIFPASGKRLYTIALPAMNSALRYADTRISVNTNVNETRVSHSVKMSRGWRGDPARSYAFPDFSGIAGYVPALDLPPSAEVSWDLARDDFNQPDFTAGRKILTSTRRGTIAP